MNKYLGDKIQPFINGYDHENVGLNETCDNDDDDDDGYEQVKIIMITIAASSKMDYKGTIWQDLVDAVTN